MTLNTSNLLHPWHDHPDHQHDFAHEDGKGGFWYYGPNHTADCVILSNEENPRIALVTRRDNGLLALPGGFIDTGETALEAAIREAREEIGISLSNISSLQIYDGPVADPRASRKAWPHTTAFRFVIEQCELNASDDAMSAAWYDTSTMSAEDMHGSHFYLARLAISKYETTP